MSKPDMLQSRIQNEIQQLTQSVSGLIENFHRLKSPLVESREKVPQATNQLDKISEQTEAAAHRMLDTVEQITQREEQVIAGLEKITTLATNGDTAAITTLAKELSGQATTTLNDAYAIMTALQFQDITSQQMDHAASLLEDIEGKLHDILGIIGGEEFMATLNSVKIRRVRAYDPHADLTDQHAKQADIDSLFQQTKRK